MTATPDFLPTLREAALKSGDYLKEAFLKSGSKEVEYKQDTPIGTVTQYDRPAEELIRKVLRAKYPDMGFVGEEAGNDGNRSARYVAYIDPLDGTTNFSQGLPQWCSMIAIYDTQEKRIAASLIYVPMENRMYDAEWNSKSDGYVAYKNTNRIKTAPVKSDSGIKTAFTSIIGHCLGRGYLSESETDLLHRVNKAMEDQKFRIRVSGSSGYDAANMIASMAAGNASIGMARAGGAWDFLAIMPMMQALGGTFKMPVDAKPDSDWHTDASQVARMRIDDGADSSRYFDWLVWGSEPEVNLATALISRTRKEHAQSRTR
jgi:fructose-1,6-bisphosphatase/inositol monophosphatase family enzyme